MSETEIKARELFASGYNCAQAVFLAVCGDMDMEFDDAARLVSAFGGGMGGTRNTCGAVSAMVLAAGHLWGYTNSKDDMAGRRKVYAKTKAMLDKFEAENGSLICRELLLENRKTCADKVAECVRLLQEAIAVE
ncbi:MAG: C_GCAxxG_C_C family protein [Oscillospiraceae bacterium]|nr:C_GCAxxG_C_C family protein [Oscillospiraceae bacterium]